MPGVVRVHLLPTLIPRGALDGGVAIVIDQLRASTTICAALAAGARAVVPFLTEPEVLEFRAARAPGECLAGGERGCVRIPGFDLANSPREYTSERVRAKTIALTTTNGTRALHACEGAHVRIGCLANRAALCAHLADERRDIHIVCAGTHQEISLDDVLAAGAIAAGLAERERSPSRRTPDDCALLAIAAWRDASSRPDGVLDALRASRAGQNLIGVGLADDLEYCSCADVLSVIPVYDRAAGEITPAAAHAPAR